jgi:hypothetical protein
MPRLDTARDEYARQTANWIAIPDRRQCEDRRSGPARGGRRLTDPPRDPLQPAVWIAARSTARRVERPMISFAAARVKAALRQISFLAL